MTKVMISEEMLGRLLHAASNSLSFDELAGLKRSVQRLPFDEAPQLLTQQQVASLLGVDRTTIWRLVQCGRLRPVEILPGLKRYSRIEVEFLAAHGCNSKRQHSKEAA